MADLPWASAVNWPGAVGTLSWVMSPSTFEGVPVPKELIAETL